MECPLVVIFERVAFLLHYDIIIGGKWRTPLSGTPMRIVITVDPPLLRVLCFAFESGLVELERGACASLFVTR